MSLYSDWKARAENLESDAAYQQYWSNEMVDFLLRVNLSP